MSSYIQQSLTSDEEIIQRFPLHWFAWIPFWILVLLIITIPVALFEFLRLKGIERGVTNKRVIAKTGVISRKTEEMKLSSIETVVVDQTIVGRIFGYGKISVTGRGISSVIMKSIDSPLKVKKAIEEAG